MKKTFKVLTSLLMTLAVLFSISAVAFADYTVSPSPASIEYTGQTTNFVFAPGSEDSQTDLFPGFKNVMPGDSVRQQILFTNKAEDCDYVCLYVKAVPHSADNLPVVGEDVDRMNDFLSKLRLSVGVGSKWISSDSADQPGGLSDFVPLGTFRRGEQALITAQLDVPIELDNQYANCIGEVDWVFKVEALDDQVTIVVNKVWSDNGINRPDQVKVGLYDGNELVDTAILSAKNGWCWSFLDLDLDCDWSVREIDVPAGYEPRYEVHGADVTITNVQTYWGKLIQTGQMKWPIPVLGGLGLILVVIGVIFIRKSKKNAHE